MEELKKLLDRVNIPTSRDKVYKDECMLSFDTPITDTGLYICMASFLSFGREYVSLFSEKTGNKVFLHLHTIEKKLPPEKNAEPEKKIVRLAIGAEGGFNPDAGKNRVEYIEDNSIVILPSFEVIPFPNEDLPEVVTLSANGILKSESLLKTMENKGALAVAWNGDIRQPSAYAESLKQLDNRVKVSPLGWKCQLCDKTENLWLNLTDGTIMCGRRQLDGSGGNNHAVEHYKTTGYPLTVKLGTISSTGTADVFSYAEDDMHFGINMSVMEKSDKTMEEIEIEINQRAWEWSRLTESGVKLVPKFGPGYTGMKNLGNTCYMNSVMQTLFCVPNFIDSYYLKAKETFKKCSNFDTTNSFHIQLTKLAVALLCGKYSRPPPEDVIKEYDIDDYQKGISPIFFHSLMGKGHPEFSTKKQQDSMEFLDHILKLISKNSPEGVDPGDCFQFEVEDKFVCPVNKKVKYSTRGDMYLPLPVPLECAINREEVQSYEKRKLEYQSRNEIFKEESVRYRIPFDSCISKFKAPVDVTVRSSAVNKDVLMKMTTRLKTFPDYLFIQLLDLSCLRGYGIQPGEVLLPDSTSGNRGTDKQIDAQVVHQLAEMGFPLEACRKAVALTGNIGSEAAMNWIMDHMNDHDFSDPLPDEHTREQSSESCLNENDVAMLVSMGFSKDKAIFALQQVSGNVESAVEWIFNHHHELDSLMAATRESRQAKSQKIVYKDGTPQYDLLAIISHMGNSIHAGHYVCHIKKDNEWTIFNDNKCALTEKDLKVL